MILTINTRMLKQLNHSITPISPIITSPISFRVIHIIYIQVAYVEKDSKVYSEIVQYNAPWGLARISHRQPLGFITFTKYLYDATAGSDVTVYIVDTGINIDHVDFGSRARWGHTVPDND